MSTKAGTVPSPEVSHLKSHNHHCAPKAPAASDEITNVEYDINAGTVTAIDPVIAFKTSVRNDTDEAMQQGVNYSYEKWAVGTWNNVNGENPKETQTFIAGVPFVNPEFKISVSAPSVHEFGGEGVRETVTASASFTVPAHTGGTVSVVVRNASIKVPFTYKQGGGTKNGIYKNLDSWKVDIVLDWN